MQYTPFSHIRKRMLKYSPSITNEQFYNIWNHWKIWKDTDKYSKLTIHQRISGVTKYNLEARLVQYLLTKIEPTEEPILKQSYLPKWVQQLFTPRNN